MAAGFRDSEKIGLGNDTDFTVSHRTPPPVPNSPTATYSLTPQVVPRSPPLQQVPRSPPIGQAFTADAHVAHLPGRHNSQAPPPSSPAKTTSLRGRSQSQSQQEQHPHQLTRVRTGDNPNSDETPSATAPSQQQAQQAQSGGRKRGGSFSFLKRTASNSSSTSKRSEPAVYQADRDAPPLPKTLIAQASAEAAVRREQQKLRKASTDSDRKSSFTMLRKSSKLKKEAQAEAERQAAAVPRQPPHLPSLPFVSDETRPDSVAIFNNAYTHSSSSPPSQPRTTANFSRPSNAMAPASNLNSSSSPAYATRSASGLTGSSSPPGRANGEYVVDPTSDRTESMTNRGRYSYASSVGQTNVNSPRRVRRRKDPTPFNVLVIGAKNSGKSSFISFLRHSLALPAHKQPTGQEPEPQVGGTRSSFTSHYLETEMDGERMGLTLWDSVGLEKNIVDLQLREMTAFVEAKFEDTFVEEQKVMRSPGVKDTHIHCVFLILDPVRLDSTISDSPAFKKNGSHSGSLDDDLDLQVLRALWGKTTVIPVISKADTLTVSHMSFLKRAVWSALKGAKLDPLEALELEEDDEDDDEDSEELDGEEEDKFEGDSPQTKRKKAHNRQSSLSLVNGHVGDDETPYLPMSILSPDIYDLPPFVPKSKSSKPEKVGRKFPWGFADPYDPEHCDFGRLRDSIFSEWRSELRELSRTKWYENWRTSRLKNLPGSRQRVKGGVTPVAAVPKAGRQFSPPVSQAVPRSVSAMSNAASAGSGQPLSKSGRDVSGSSQTGSVRTYQ